MKRNTLALALAGLALIPALAGAQERHPREGYKTQEPVRTRVFTYNNNRARLGVTVQFKADPETDKLGARIQEVLPDGPAEKAGLKAGDIITRFNGTSLVNAASEEEDQSGPGKKLVELAQALDPGDSVKVDYRRDGQARSTTVVAAEVEPTMFSNFDPQEFRKMPFEGPGGGAFEMNPGPGMSFFFDRGGAGGLDLVEMNSDLGEYFGTSEGLLLTSAPEDSSSALRAGDVILSIDGRKPTSVSQAGRILGSYENGETAKLEIMRKHQRITVDWKVNRPEMRMRQMLPGRMEHTQHM
jgi:C-terminal processing protease CtpA/Prc